MFDMPTVSSNIIYTIKSKKKNKKKKQASKYILK